MNKKKIIWLSKRQKKGVVPLMELPPLSPGIQASVIEEVEVVDTVKRGWSGGTDTPAHKYSQIL